MKLMDTRLMETRIASACVLFLLLSLPLHARITHIEFTSRGPAFNGQAFGNIGQYEKLKGVATGELDPKDKHNALITDINLAPKNANGMVEYRTNFTMVKPAEMRKASGVLFYNVVNRGGHNGPNTFGIGGDPGDGFLYKMGQVVLWAGWQGDLPLSTDGSDFEGIEVPVAKGVTGQVWERWYASSPNAPTAALTRTPASLDTTKAKLITATHETPDGVKSGLQSVPATDWAFADCSKVPFPGTPDPKHICVKGGMDPALLYELTYTAKDPPLLGVGMAATRDIISYFLNNLTPDNPVDGRVEHVICMGNSQSGRFEKEFVNLGFNEDENGKTVCDGMNTRIAGYTGGFNIRFAKPGDMAELYDPGSDAALWWSDTKEGPGLLHRCQKTDTCPKITETYGGPEIWYSRATIGITGTDMKQDLPLPANVRRYYHPGTAHGGGRGGFQLDAVATNPNPQRETDRALYVALVDWVVKNTPPPPSAYPNLKDGTLVPPSPAGVMNPLIVYDYGKNFNVSDESGVIDTVPPKIVKSIMPLAPKVDADGNELGGVPSLLFRVPLGTYRSWAPIPEGALKGRERSLAASYIPFAKTKAERMAKNDPRLSIEERYPTMQSYLDKLKVESDKMVKDRYLLPEDATRLLDQAKTDLTAAALWK